MTSFQRRWHLIAPALVLAAVLAILGPRLAAALGLLGGPEAVHVAGLSAPVTVVRDRWDVPHLFAASERDLFAAQGYVTARDRLWQMLLRRQAARGQLSDWLGTAAAEADALLAGQDFYAQGRLAQLNAGTREALEAYAAGVNAWLAQVKTPGPYSPGKNAPVEFALLASRGISISLQPWTSKDCLALAGLIDWGQTLAGTDPRLHAELVAQLGNERAADVWDQVPPPYPVAPHSPGARQVLQWAAIPLPGPAVLSADYSTPVVPPAWTMTGLHSLSYEALGASLPGLPGVVAGRGAQRAWSMAWQAETLEAGRAGRACYACVGFDQVKPPPLDLSSTPAQRLVPYLVALEPRGWLQRRVSSMMARWNYSLEAGSAPAAVYEAWLVALGRRTFEDELGAELHARYAASGREPAALARLAGQPDSPWWNDTTTPQRETRDEIMQLAYAEALEYLGRQYGDLHTIWEWGQMHAATFEHALGDAWPASILIERGPLALGGDGSTNFTPFDPAVSFRPQLVPALMWRITAAGDLSFALAGEQSGTLRLPALAAGLAAWHANEFVPLEWDPSTNAGSSLTLLP